MELYESTDTTIVNITTSTGNVEVVWSQMYRFLVDYIAEPDSSQKRNRDYVRYLYVQSIIISRNHFKPTNYFFQTISQTSNVLPFIEWQKN
jgi:hypothetical protein